jgi:hypothetical protein
VLLGAHILLVSVPKGMPRKKLAKFLEVDLEKEGGENKGVGFRILESQPGKGGKREKWNGSGQRGGRIG